MKHVKYVLTFQNLFFFKNGEVAFRKKLYKQIEVGNAACSFELAFADIVQKTGAALFKLKQYIFPLHRLYSYKTLALKNLKKLLMTHRSIKLISIFVLAFTFNQKTFALGNESVSKDLIFLEELKEDYYKGKVSRLPEALAVFGKYEPLLAKENLAKSQDADLILVAIKSMDAVSCYLATNATEYRVMSRLFDAEKVLKRYLSYSKGYRSFSKEKRVELLLAFSDYLFSQITWNTKRVEVIMNLPIWYRKILLLEPHNMRAKLKLVSWFTYSTNYAYPRQIQWLKNHESYFSEMHSIDRFNAYMDYSMFYMQILETQKAYEFLSRAKEIFAANPYAQIIEDFYAKGKVGFH